MWWTSKVPLSDGPNTSHKRRGHAHFQDRHLINWQQHPRESLKRCTTPEAKTEADGLEMEVMEAAVGHKWQQFYSSNFSLSTTTYHLYLIKNNHKHKNNSTTEEDDIINRVVCLFFFFLMARYSVSFILLYKDKNRTTFISKKKRDLCSY